MQNVNARRLATKILSSLVALTLVLQPMAAGATAVSDSWLQMINGSSSSVGTSTSAPQYPSISGVSASKWKVTSSDTTVVTYTLGAYASNLQVNVYGNNATRPIATLYDAFQNAGTYTSSWNTSGVAVGTYKIEVKATNALGVVAVGSTKVYVVPSASKAATLTNVNVAPSVFSIGQSTQISFTTDVTSLVTVNVMPVGYDAVTTEPIFSQDVLMSGSSSRSVSWNGTDKNGTYVAAADYIVLVAAINDQAAVFSPEKTVRFDGQGYTPIAVRPGVSIFDAAPNPFDSVNQSMAVKFNLDAQATISVAVKNQYGATVFTDTKAASTTQIGFNQYMYGGQVTTSVDQGRTAPYAKDGNYTITLTAANSAGTSTDSRSFTVVNNPAQAVIQVTPSTTISGTTFTPNPFNVQTQNATVSYTLSGSALVEFNVYSNGGLVYTTGKVSKSAGYNSTVYTGYNQSGSLLPAGTYTYDVRVYDVSTGAFTTQSPNGSFQVTNYVAPQPPVIPTISGTTFTPYVFHVKTENATVSYALSGSALAEFNVYSNGGLVYTSGKVSKSAGTNSTVYTGYNQSGSLLSSGYYTYDVRLYDASGVFMTQSPNGSFQVVNDPTVVTPPASPKPYFSAVSFTPNPLNVRTQNATLSYNLSTSGSVRLNVFTNSGSLVYSGSQTNVNAGLNNLVYQGFNNSNSLLPTGSYTYQLISYASTGEQVDTANGSFQATNDSVVVVTPPTNTTPYFQSVNFTPSTFDVRNTNASISFSLQNNGYVAFKVEDLNGNTVYNMSSLGGITYLPNMTHTLTYTGVNNNGTLLSSGTYRYVITSTAPNGSGSDAKSGYFTAVNSTPAPTPSYDEISSYSFSPSTFDPRYGSATVSFSLVDSVFVVFRTEDLNGNTQYERSAFYSSGYNSFSYDGRDSNGNILTNGTYTYKLLVFKGNGTLEAKQGNFGITGQTPTPTPSNVPYISGQFVTPNPYNPDQGPLRLNYTLSTQAYTTVTILKDSNIVKTLKVNQLENGGANSAVWDGRFPDSRFAAGATATPGAYIMRIAAYNNYGSAQTTDVVFTVSTAAQAVCAGFKDVSVTSAYCSAIEEMKRLGVFAGYSDGTFRPETPINRAETVKVIMMALKYNVPTSGWWFDSAGFRDINSAAWYTPYLAAARIYGIINGYPDNTFKPANTVNRAEMLKIFLEGASIGKAYVKCEKPYADNTAGKWFTGYACIARQYSLVDAVNGQFMGAKLMTRGDVAIMIYRAQILGLLNNLPPKKQVQLPQLSNYGAGVFNPSQVQTTVDKLAIFPPPAVIPKY
ncbi:MAG: S-layer homology domain-containing protein [Candidatus Peregrinibacteria bacterium]|nr:S-layer homology domain-containing protein [Candidatus Peregrinibacteria bacterium]